MHCRADSRWLLVATDQTECSPVEPWAASGTPNGVESFASHGISGNLSLLATNYMGTCGRAQGFVT